MSNYVIFTDSSCDLSNDELAKRKIYSNSLHFRFDGDDKEYSNDEISLTEFYDEMRKGRVAKTSAVNSQTFLESFENLLQDGIDILYIGFSSGLSTTYNSARLASIQLKEKYLERKIITVDTLAASAGIALLIDLIIERKEAGASIEEAAQFAEDMKMKISHWFTVDDLVYLKRGGRISPTTAFVGNMLGIKPILHVDNDGHLLNIGKVRGRKLSIATLAQKYSLLHEDDYNVVYISHGDCFSDAKELSEILSEKYGAKTKLITDVGAVIGAHSGPGTLALFFIGKAR